MKFISVIALKGGVGKTVTTINLAANLAARGYRVLVVDADPQCNTTSFYCKVPPDCGTEELLIGMIDCYETIVFPTVTKGVDVIPASSGLFSLDAAAMLGNGKAHLRAMLDLRLAVTEDESYDVILVDCPPGFTAASISAIYASDLLIVPTQLDKMSIQGWMTLKDQISGLGSVMGHTPEMRCLITMRDRTELSKQMEPMLRDMLPCFDTAIRRSPKVPEAILVGFPLSVWSPTCAAGKDYNSLAREIAQTMEGGANNGKI